MYNLEGETPKEVSMSWIIAHWAELLAAFMLLLRAAEAFAALTPTDKDNKFIAWLKEYFRFG